MLIFANICIASLMIKYALQVHFLLFMLFMLCYLFIYLLFIVIYVEIWVLADGIAIGSI